MREGNNRAPGGEQTLENSRRPYVAPKLVRLGSVTDLTAGPVSNKFPEATKSRDK